MTSQPHRYFTYIFFLSVTFSNRFATIEPNLPYFISQMVACAKEWSSYYWGRGYEYRKQNPQGKRVGEPGRFQVMQKKSLVEAKIHRHPSPKTKKKKVLILSF